MTRRMPCFIFSFLNKARKVEKIEKGKWLLSYYLVDTRSVERLIVYGGKYANFH